MPTLKVKKLDKDAKLPFKKFQTDTGYDLVAVSDPEFIEDKDTKTTFIEYKTGIAIEIPEGYWAAIFPRSSVSKKTLVLANSVGVIDEQYRGEVRLRFKFVHNTNYTPSRIGSVHNRDTIYTSDDNGELYNKGDKIGQLVFFKRYDFDIEEVEELNNTQRGEGGFGSTGN
ncbi:MAG: Deoxyuridine 5'-triphosphate nucleotidohydrolase [Promethearchaeota archaeon]|nr:MAG: Deoxyuridine 5'-triphosphate nucleotidohydrolase [Candidatus Lokiarchaeota archaeon]